MSAKKKNDLTGLSAFDVVGAIISTAVQGQNDGHPVRVSKAKLAGVPGLFVFISGFTMDEDNQIMRVTPAKEQESEQVKEGS